MRRLRSSDKMEAMMSETHLHPSDLILPLFFDENISRPQTTGSMPGVTTWPIVDAAAAGSEAEQHGIGAVLVFGVPKIKDPVGTQAYAKDGVSQNAIRALKENTDLLVIADLCMCEYTDHGHCGILNEGKVDNDPTLLQYAKIAVSQAEAGADIIAPSGMMDGQVAAIRNALDNSGHRDVAIMAYSAKYCSSFYGPFRDVAHTSLGRGNRSGYQMQCGNRREAMREIELDISEGTDIIMVKPALPYLDVISEARRTFNHPIAAYHVSGEYSMIKAAGANGWLNEEKTMMESLLSIKRAGADVLITYYAKEAADILRCGNGS